MLKDSVLTANFAEKGLTITIYAKEHNKIDPTRKNYRIPIYIKADENISSIKINKLVVEIDKNVFFPRRVDNNVSMKIEDDETI
jgi:hypothetical protein